MTSNLNSFTNVFQNVGVHYETYSTGILGPVTLKGLNGGTRDLTKQKWSYKVCNFAYLQQYSYSFFNCVHLRNIKIKTDQSWFKKEIVKNFLRACDRTCHLFLTTRNDKEKQYISEI